MADIVPSPPWADVIIAGPSPRSRLGGSGQADNLSDANHSQTLAVGDFNADGIQDLAISAPDAELIVGSTIRKAGAVYVILGRRDFSAAIDTATARPGGADLTILGVTDGDRFGFALTAADVNGDGVTDLIVGAPQVNSSSSQAAGAVYVLLGARSFGGNSVIDLQQQSADLVIHGAGERFGAAIAAGDAGGQVSAAPIADLLIGAPGSSPDSSGSAYLLIGRAEFGKSIRDLDIGRAADFTITGSVRQRLGAAVAIGDFNGDGVGDLFAGAPGADRPFRADPGGPAIVPASAAGAVFGLLSPVTVGGHISADSSGGLLSFYGADANHHLGQSIASGDLTGDGIADLAIAAPEAAGAWKDSSTGIIYNMDAHAGAVYIFAGSRSLSPQRIDLAASVPLTTYVELGGGWTGFGLVLGSYNVAGNADTTADVIIGSPGGESDPSRHIPGRGSVAVLFGGRTLGSATTRPRSPFNPPPVPEEVDLFSVRLPASSGFGFAVAAGDINGDGAGDVIVAAPFVEAAGRAQAGQVLIWLGTTRPPGGGDDPTPPTVRVVSPAAGERLIGGKSAVISWIATSVEQLRGFDVLLSTDGGVSFSSSIATGLPASQTSYSWTAPSVCATNARIEVVATTNSGERVVAMTEGSFAIGQAGPAVDLSHSSIEDGSLSLTSAAGEVFPDGVVVEISTDAAGAAFQGFSRAPKIKGGGRKLKTRGTIDGKGLDQFFPDGEVRALRLSGSPCALTVVSVRRQGSSLVPVPVD
ncbi:MAG TPA: hypothetical protein VJ464_11275 [Blastocatellia bacterium]|nr:hypothetical protein [Blastocatellia bacterium]